MTRGRGGCSFESLRPPVTSGASTPNQPSKPCHIWATRCTASLQNPVTSGDSDPAIPFKTLSHLGIWDYRNPHPFKTLSHLGSEALPVLQNPVTSGPNGWRRPSKPCHIWAAEVGMTFKTLSHLGRGARTCLQNPVTSGRQVRPFGLQNPVTSGKKGTPAPSKPCHIWEGNACKTFKTLSHLGFYAYFDPSKPCHIWVLV